MVDETAVSEHGCDKEPGERDEGRGTRDEVKNMMRHRVADYIRLKISRLGAVGRGIGVGRLHRLGYH